MEKKLRDLGFLVTQGFDLKRSIRDYKKEREAYISDAIPQIFLFYIVFMRYGVCLHFTEFISEVPVIANQIYLQRPVLLVYIIILTCNGR